MGAADGRTLRLAPLWEPGGAVLAFGVGPCPDELLAIVAATPDRAPRPSHAGPARRRAPPPPRALRVVAPDGPRFELPNERAAFTFVQPLPDGRTLLAAARTRSTGPDNVCIVDADGRRVASFGIGDGVEDVQTTPTGAIWASYFDEGILGGDGIRPGLVCFGPDGERRFVFSPADADTDMIIDCYALNVADDHDTWLYFYTEFPLVRLRDGRAETWHGAPRGAHALAVDGDYVAFYGSYETPSTVHVMRREGPRPGRWAERQVARLVPEGTLTLATTDGEPLVATRVIGRGDALYLGDGERLYRASVDVLLMAYLDRP